MLLKPTDAADNPDIRWALFSPPLIGTARPPDDFNFADFAHLTGVRTIVSLIKDDKHNDCSPLTRHHYGLQDLHGVVAPTDPHHEPALVAQAAAAVDDLITTGSGVVVHCNDGTGRTGTVIGAVLVGLGAPPDEVKTWLDAVQQQRSKPGWPDSPWPAGTLGPPPDMTEARAPTSFNQTLTVALRPNRLPPRKVH